MWYCEYWTTQKEEETNTTCVNAVHTSWPDTKVIKNIIVRWDFVVEHC